MGRAMAITGVLNVGFIGSSFVAAVLWFMSAAMPRLPKRMTVGFAGTGGTQDDLLKTLVMQSGLTLRCRATAEAPSW